MVKKLEGYKLYRKFSIIQRYSQIFISNHLINNKFDKCHPPMLMTIYLKEGLTQNELASFMKFNKGAVAKLVKVLEAEDYIYRCSDENDKRLQRLYLAERGKKAIPAIMTLEQELSEKLVKGFSDDEKEVLHSMLERVIENISSN